MDAARKAKGSRGLRFFVVLLSLVLGLLVYWLLSFVERDIGTLRGPDWPTTRREFVKQAMDDEKGQLEQEVRAYNRRIAATQEQQQILTRSIDSLQKTLNQLLSIQRQYIEKGQALPAESMQTLTESQTAFLENQQQDQRYTQELSTLIQERQQREASLSSLSETIEELESEARGKHQQLTERYRLKAAFLKLSFLVPVFLLLSFLFIKFRAGTYSPLVWASFIAAFVKIATVAHEYFPRQYFKYIAILVVMAIVLRLLVYLIRMIAVPKKDLLIKQYQQFYDRHLCPICTKPIKTGPLRYAGDKKRGGMIPTPAAADYTPQPYVCPACGTDLYGACADCGKIRHTLLPYCEHCGAEAWKV